MYRVKYIGKQGVQYRRYSNYDYSQVKATADNYGKRHGLVWASIEKEY